MRTLWAFICALLATHIIGTIASAAPHLSWLASQGMDITTSVRLDAYLQAITGMLLAYLPLAGIALLIGFAVASFIVARVPSLTTLGYALAGFAAMIVLMLILNTVFEIAAIPSTRSVGGLLAQGAAGAIGGLMFKLMKTKPVTN